MNTVLQYLKTTATKHLLFIGLLVVAFVVGRSWLQEHDARLKSEATVKTAETAIQSLQKTQTAVAQAAKVTVTVLQKQADAVKTPVQAEAALKTDTAVKAALPSMEALPEAPDRVSVDAVELFKGVNKCEIDAVNVGACTKELDIQKQIDGQKDTEIVALKKKPAFWHRVKGALITLGIGAALGYAASHH